MEQSASGRVDVTQFDVHGLVRVRVEGAPQRVLDVVSREIGQPESAPSGEPDLTVTFTDRLETAGPLRFLGLRQAAFDDRYFYLLDRWGSKGRIELSELGTRPAMLCESAMRHIPLLIPLIGLAMVRKEHVLLHAASFVYRGKGVLVTGWQKGGKTETLLPFMADGGEFMADEWTAVGGEGPTMYGIANVARLWDWHLRQLPQYWEKLDGGTRARIRAWRAFHGLYGAIPGADRVPGPVGRRLRRLNLVGGSPWQAANGLVPSDLFGDRIRRGGATVDRVILPVVGADPDVAVLPTAGAEVARRMVNSLAFEREALLTAYEQYRFAFPDRRSPAIEDLPREEERILGRVLAGVPALELRHPYPVDLEEMRRAAAPFVEATADAVRG